MHFGPGAFHRAHQADYIDRLLEHDPRWRIAAVSLRSGDTIEAMKRQDGRYTLVILDAQTSFRTISAHDSFLGPEQARAVRARLAAPEVRIVSSTVTEKGYCLTTDGTLDFDHPDIVHDLADPERPVSLIGWLALGLGDRRAAGLPPFTSLCCDNLPANGKKLGHAVLAFTDRLDPDLARWIGGEARFPNTMVDSISPAADERLRALVRERTGFDDAVPVCREAYSAWVIEDILPADSPNLASVGVVVTPDVSAWEKAKLRILNGAHSSLAYIGLLRGHETVADAMADASLAGFVETLVGRDIVPALDPSPLDLPRYASETLARFRNPAIGHRLAQIAWDGSQKLPYRLLDTIREAKAAGRPLDRLAVPVAAWMLFVERQARAGAEIVDPLAPALARAASAGETIRNLLALRQVFPAALAAHEDFRRALETAAARLREGVLTDR